MGLIFDNYSIKQIFDISYNENNKNNKAEYERRTSRVSSNSESYSTSVRYIDKTDEYRQIGIKRTLQFSDGAMIGCVPRMAANIVEYYCHRHHGLVKDLYMEESIAYPSDIGDSEDITMRLAQRIDDYIGSYRGRASVRQFVEGMTEYCADRHYRIRFDDCVSDGTVDYEMIKSMIRAGRPIALFADRYAVSSINAVDDADRIDTVFDTVPHAMTVFGYRSISYVLPDSSVRNDLYLLADTGKVGFERGYCNMQKSIVDAAIAIEIY